MERLGIIWMVLMSFGIGGGAVHAMGETTILSFRGASDASAGVALDGHQIVVADDETNQLRIYDTRSPGLPTKQVDLTAFTVIDHAHPELDLEGAARMGHLIYWIGSHGRNKDGKLRVNRQCLFATEVVETVEGVTLVPKGRVYRGLIEDLLGSEALAKLELKKSVELAPSIEQTEKAQKKLAPKQTGLNIEGLAADTHTGILYLGFRNPRPRGSNDEGKQALVVPLLNAQAVLLTKAKAQLGAPILLDLKGLGIRSLTFLPSEKTYLLMAGAHNEASNFVLYRWSGTQGGGLKPLRTMKDGLNYEAIIPLMGREQILLLSDDGSKKVKHPVTGKKVANKTLEDLSQRSFRGVMLGGLSF